MGRQEAKPTSADWPSTLARLRSRVPSATFESPDAFAELPTVHARLPLVQVVIASDTSTLSAALRESSPLPVYVLGGGTSLDYGELPRREGLGLVTTGLDRIVDYPARDMTITVEAGISARRLAEVLAEEGQQLPVDLAQPDEATLGGALATNTSGPRRYGYGTLRDYVIGIRAVDAEGTAFKGGGRVVKNVAGYDLPKLLVGSMGTLAVITEVTLKLRPLPDTDAAVVTALSDLDVLSAVLDALVTSRERPTYLELLNRQGLRRLASVFAAKRPSRDNERAQQVVHASAQRHAPKPVEPRTLNSEPSLVSRLSSFDPPAWTLLVGFEGSAAVVAWQCEQVAAELDASGGADIVTCNEPDSRRLLEALTDLPARPSRLSFKANLLPSRLPDFCAHADRAGFALQAHAGNGIVHAYAVEDADLAACCGALTGLAEHAVAARGSLVLLRPLSAPPGAAAGMGGRYPTWGRARPDHELMRKLKDALDPHHRLNPGRFLPGI